MKKAKKSTEPGVIRFIEGASGKLPVDLLALADPFTRPGPPEAQWEAVEKTYRRSLETGDPGISGWELLEEMYEADQFGNARGTAIREGDQPPLAMFFALIERGLYPPPELMHVLLSAWKRYMYSGGDLSLEEAFLGPVRPRAGNYSRRKRAAFIRSTMRWIMSGFVHAGNTRTKAAELTAAELERKFHVRVEPETILRTVRPFKPKAK